MKSPMINRTKMRLRAAIKLWLDETNKPKSLFAVSVKADELAKAFDKRRKHDLFESLDDYQRLVPSTWTGRWLQSTNGGDAIYMITPPGWTEHSSVNESLVLSAGSLVNAKELNL